MAGKKDVPNNYQSPEIQIAWARMVARAVVDEEFRKRLTENPVSVFDAYGVKLDKEVDVNKDMVPPLDKTLEEIERQRVKAETSNLGPASTVCYCPSPFCGCMCQGTMMCQSSISTVSPMQQSMQGHSQVFCGTGPPPPSTASFHCIGTATTPLPFSSTSQASMQGHSQVFCGTGPPAPCADPICFPYTGPRPTQGPLTVSPGQASMQARSQVFSGPTSPPPCAPPPPDPPLPTYCKGCELTLPTGCPHCLGSACGPYTEAPPRASYLGSAGIQATQLV
jgi:hypothetical protein